MEENNKIVSHILHGCKLARELESKLHFFENRPNFLSSSCEEITRAFQDAMDLLNAQNTSSHTHHMIVGEPSGSAGVRYFLGSSYTQGMEIFETQPHPMAGQSPFDVHMMPDRPPRLELGSELPAGNTMMEFLNTGGDTEAFLQSGPSGMAPDMSDSGTSAGRSRTRKDAEEKRTIKVPAPREGNPETPPEDGFTWRKYGQKEILNSRFPRAYYRCTHKNYYGCDAKKLVQRLDDDPHMLEVTYRGHHTCVSPPASSHLMIQPPVSASDTAHGMLVGPTVSTTMQLSSSWPPTRFDGQQKDQNALLGPHMFGELQATGESSATRAETSSHLRSGSAEEAFADFIFNSASSSNSIDAIFSPKKENQDA